MRKKPFSFMNGRFGLLWYMVVFLSATFSAKGLLAEQDRGDKPSKAEVVEHIKKLQIPFIANKGQIDKKVKFYANTFGGTVFVTKDGEIVYSLPGGKNEEFGNVRVNGLTPMLGSEQGKDTRSRDVDARSKPNKILTLKETIVGGKINEVKGEKKAITNVNYFKGKDPSKWKTNILTYDVINLGEVYEGIELKLKAHGNNVEKLFCVRPGGEIESIKMKLGGAKALKLDKEGQLEVKTELGAVKFTKPVAYQEINGEKVEVDVEYCIQEEEARGQKSELRRQKSGFLNPKSKISTPQLEYGFKVASYDKTKELVIDPLLASTYVGGSNYDRALSIAIDTSGNVYVGGSTISSNFPTTSGVYDASFNGGASDAFLLRFNSDLTNLLASTYLGGSKDDYIYSIVIGTGGNIYMCGDTGSSDFPTTTGAYDTSINNVSNYYDGFVTKLDSGLTSLLASTYLGGSNSDHPRSITIDSGGNIYVSGMTYSSDFPTTTGAYDTSFNGGVFDSFISKFNGTLTSLLSSTYLGGSGNEYSQFQGPSIAIDTSGNILVTGTTYSSDFPTTTGAYDTSLGGDRDAFVSKISGDLTNLLASTYLGGSIYDEGYSIAGDSSGNIYVVGYTYSSDFPTTTGAYDTSYNSGNDAFVSKFNGSLTGLLASTYLGGSNGDEANALVIDSSGNIYIAGFTDSSEFPTTASAYDISRGGATDAFISEFNGALTSLLASTYLGGSGIGDVCYSLAIDSGGNIYATGYTKSSDFPTTTGAYDTSYNDSSGSYDAFIAKLDSNLSATPSDTTAPSGSISINSGASYTNSTTVTVTLSATDTVGVTGYYLSDSSTTPSASASGWTSVTSTTSYSGSVSYTLSSGEGSKTIYAWYKDAAGNVSSTANVTITYDTTVPTVTISSPTSSSTYTATSSTIILGGSASDSSSGISSVAWSNNRGGNGTATGTASWTVSSISLSTGDNVITVTAKDGANNSGTDTLQVTYNTSSTVGTPTVSTGSATNVTTSSATLNGTVNANGGTTTAWFQYGSTSGSYGNTSSTQTVTGSSNTTVSIGISGLSSGTTYYYRIAASNSGGTSYGSELSFTTTTATATPIPTPSTGDSSAPTDCSITINSGASYTNSTGVTLTLSAKDNIGITGYYLSSSSSTPSSSTSGWTSVSSTTTYSGSVSYTLSSGDGSKTVYVWFKDASGNVSSSASDDITLDTSVPAITITSPTSDATYTATSSTISLGGSASDSTSGIKEVTWTNSSGGSGTASGTTSWTISSISLSNGDTTITVTAKDNAGNTATDTITVTYKSTSTNVPKVSTGSATNVTETSATLNGTVNANGLTATAWFYYGTNSGSYTSTSSTQTISGSSDTAISINISGLIAGTKYYYKLSAQNSAGTSTGSEASLTTKSLTTTPTPGVTPLPTLPPLPTPQVSPSPIQEGIVFGFVNDQDELPLKGVTITITGKNSSDSTETDENGYYEFSGLSKGNYTLTYEKEGFLDQTQDISLNEGEVKDLGTVTMEQVVSGKIYGNVVDIKGNPLEFVRLRLKGVKTKVIKTASSDADGFFEFADLEPDTYVIIAKKKKYRNAQQKVTLEEGESTEIEIVMKKTSKRIKGLLLEEDIQ